MMLRQTQHKKAHFIGIGGIGVSALARYYLSQGWEVVGTNLANAPENAPLLRELKAEGIKVRIGYDKKNLERDTDLVVYTRSEPQDNPELKEARRRKIEILTYPEALGKLSEQFTAVALAGTHGKSTSTALTALVFFQAKLDPTVIIGTKVPQFKNRNFRLGNTSTNSVQRSNYLIIEADEYKDAFLNYFPRAALITNIDREHLDYFKNLTRTKKSFRQFIGNVAQGGTLVLNKDNAPLLSFKKQPSFAKATKGKKIIWYSLREKKLAQKIKKHLSIPGEHNLSNALGVYKLSRSLGVREKDILRAFAAYRGAYRRMEYRGKFKIQNSKSKIPVYDDYAHHPTEIKATLSAFREKFPKSKIICVFQPHQAERLRKLFKEFSSAFDGADSLILLDIFKVRGREMSRKDQETGSRQLAQAIQKRNSKLEEVVYLPYSRDLRRTLTKLIKNNSVIVMMGAGDIVELTSRLVDSSK